MSDDSGQVRDQEVPRPHSEGMLRVPADASYLALIGTVVQWFGQRAGLSREQSCELEVAVDEACTNIIRYAYPDSSDGQIAIRYWPTPDGLTVEIFDEGQCFDPVAGRETARGKRLRDPASGGMGLSLIQQLTDAFQHQWSQRDGNHFTIVKNRENK